MGLTLEQLLDATGVSELDRPGHSKTAAAQKPDFAKLAERCRRAADATELEQDNSAEHELAEKTAAIAIIGRTLAEIRAITGEPHQKIAMPNGNPIDVDAFIKTALDSGHGPEAIADWLDKQGGMFGNLVERVGQARREGKAAKGLEKGKQMLERGGSAKAEAIRGLEDHVRRGRTLGDKQRNEIVSRLRVKHGEEAAGHLFASDPAYKDLPAAKGLKSQATEAKPPPGGGKSEGGKPKALGVNIGGVQAGLTGEQLAKAKGPAAMIGGGYLAHKAITGNGGDDKKKGVVVVNS